MNRTHVLLLLLGLAATPAAAETLVVDEDCSLADAIRSANRDEAVGGCVAGSGADEIHLSADVSLASVDHTEFSHRLDSDVPFALPAIESEITIVGHGHRIERQRGAAAMSLFHLAAEGDLSVVSTGLAGATRGGAIVRDRRAPLTLVNSTVVANEFYGLVDFEYAGGLPIATLTIENSRFYDASIYLSTTPKTIRDSRFARNGGVAIEQESGTATISHSTFWENESGLDPPGRYNSGGFVLRNSTLSGTAGGVAAAVTEDGVGTVEGSTIWNGNDQAGGLVAFAAYAHYTPQLTIRNVVVAATERDCLNAGGAIDDLGGVLDSDGTCGPGAGTITGLSTELTDNGGTTPTHALAANSSAIGAGVDCADRVDQRGYPRDPENCDSGAVEHRPVTVDLEASGFCPGEISVSITGAAPGAQIALAIAGDYARSEIPGGVCAGTALGLAAPRRIATVTADANGAAEMSRAASIGACGDLLQAIDLSSCEISDVAVVGESPTPPPCSKPAICGFRQRPSPYFSPVLPAVADEYLVGDWDGDGCDTLALRYRSTIYFDNSFDDVAEKQQHYGGGNNEDQYIVGDWNGDGCDDIAVRRGDLLLMDIDFDGSHDLTATFGPGGDADQYLAGELDGSGAEAIVVRDGGTLEWDLAPWDGIADGSTAFGGGNDEDQYLLGRWSDDPASHQTFAVRRGNQVLMNFDLDGRHDFVQTYGLGDLEDEYLVGDWDGDGRDNLAVRRGGAFEMDTDFDEVPDITMTFGGGTPVRPARRAK